MQSRIFSVVSHDVVSLIFIKTVLKTLYRTLLEKINQKLQSLNIDFVCFLYFYITYSVKVFQIGGSIGFLNLFFSIKFAIV